MHTLFKSPPCRKTPVVESVFGLGLLEIFELGLRIATGLLMTFAAGLVLLAAEVRFSAQPATLNYFRILATMETPAQPTIQGLE